MLSFNWIPAVRFVRVENGNAPVNAMEFLHNTARAQEGREGRKRRKTPNGIKEERRPKRERDSRAFSWRRLVTIRIETKGRMSIFCSMLGGSALNWTHDVLTERIEEKKRNEMDDKSRWKYRLISWNPRQIILSPPLSLLSGRHRAKPSD